eukprot:2527209-Pyramimonas_sp.AAC.2
MDSLQGILDDTKYSFSLLLSLLASLSYAAHGRADTDPFACLYNATANRLLGPRNHELRVAVWPAAEHLADGYLTSKESLGSSISRLHMSTSQQVNKSPHNAAASIFHACMQGTLLLSTWEGAEYIPACALVRLASTPGGSTRPAAASQPPTASPPRNSEPVP